MPESPGMQKCILIVNDDEDALFLLQHALNRTFPTVKVLAARCANEALTLWKSEPVDAIITDDRMPEVTGVMLTRIIRKSHPNLPILMSTSSEQSRAEAMAAGVSFFHSDGDFDQVVIELKKWFGSGAP